MMTHMFSNLAIDQTHDQHNGIVKDDAGAVDLTECSATLCRGGCSETRDGTIHY